MDSAFFQEGVGDYDQALQAYTNQMNRDQITEEAEEKPVDEFNSAIQEVGDPIGAALLHKPLLKLVKKGLQKTLGRVAKTGQKIAGDAADKLAAGDVRGAVRAVARGAQGAVSDAASAARSTASDLGDVARNAGVTGRQISGDMAQKLGVRAADPQAPSPISAETSTGTIDTPLSRATEPDLLSEPTPIGDAFGEATEGNAFSTPQLDAVANRLGTTSDQLASGSADDLATALNTDALKTGGQTLYSSSLGDAQRAAQGFQQGDSTIARATGQSGASAPQSSDAIGSDAAKPASAAAGEGDQQAGGALRQAVQDVKSAGSAGADASTAADAAAGATEGGLAGAEAGVDAAAAAEGGLNPIADIGAALLGLASILGVTFGGKHAVKQIDPEFIPSAQFGI
jgi:hypothetical protein